jgi:hypothetical protein
MRNSENRNVLMKIVNLVYDAVVIYANSMVIFAFGQLSSFRGPRIICQRSDRPKDAAAIGLRLDGLVIPDDARFEQNFIACHAAADQKQMNCTRWPHRHEAR